MLIDRPAGRDAEDGYVARSRRQAPDIDSRHLRPRPGPGSLHAGQFVNVKVTDFQAYDLVAEVPRRKGRSLSVLPGLTPNAPRTRPRVLWNRGCLENSTPDSERSDSLG